MKQYPSKEVLEQLFDVDFNTGIVRWKVRKANSIHIGDIAGTPTRLGYSTILINRQAFLVHRIIAIMANWDIEGYEIDHNNHIRNDNRLCNLSISTHIDNSRNRKLSTANTSGHVGVTWNNKKHKWISQIEVNGKNIQIGQFINKEDAILARQEANIKYGFHPNHGGII